MYYSNSISLNDWITGFTDSNGLGKVVAWQTDNEDKKALYTVTIYAHNTCQWSQVSYDLSVESLCNVQDLTLATSFASPALVQNVWEPENSLFWDDGEVIAE